jgi:hypothetical protein
MGCFNMSCALTRLPICCNDEIIVALVVQKRELGTSNTIVPAYFEAKYNDYGTFEDAVEDFKYKWFMKAIGHSESNSLGADDYIRDAIFESNTTKIKTIYYTNSYSEPTFNMVFIHKHAWLKAIEYRTHALSEWNYYYNKKPTDRESFKDNLSKTIQSHYIANDDTASETDRSRAKIELKLSESMSTIVNQSAPEITKLIEFIEDNDESKADVIEKLSQIYHDTTCVARFAFSNNVNLVTDYAGQDLNFEEYNVLVSITQDIIDEKEEYYND